jgi:hypothetical protein
MHTHRNILGAIALVLSGCSSETVAQPPPAPVNWQSLLVRPVVDAGGDIISAKERALAEVYASALSSPGIAQLGPSLDDEAHFASPGLDDAHGRGAVAHAHDLLLGAFDDRKVATSRDDGSITDVHLYVDVAIVKAQLGVGPKELLALPLPTPPTGPAQVFEQTQPASADEQKDLTVVRSWFDALENRKEVDYVGSVTDGFEVDDLEHSEPARGKEAARTYYKALHKAVGQLDTTVDNGWGVDRFAVVEYSIAGEQLGPIGWIPAQRDKVFSLELVDICEISAGQIARVWRYDNPTQILGGP